MSLPIKYRGKFFMADGGQIVLGKFIGDCPTWRVNDKIMVKTGEFHKYIFQ